MKVKVLLFALISSTLISAQSIVNETNYIEIVGVAKRDVTPDEIYLKIDLNEKDFKNKSLKEVEKVLVSDLEKLKIDVVKNLKVADLGSNFKSNLFSKEVQASKSYELKVSSAAMAAKVMNELQKDGIANVNIVKLGVSNIEQIYDELLQEATQKAKNSAVGVAKVLGQSVGKAISVQVYGYRSNDLVFTAEQATFKRAATPATDMDSIQFDTRNFSQQVTIRFELK